MISRSLRMAVEHSDDLTVRESMAYAQYLAGMAFNNASLGYVHAMAHQLGGVTTCHMGYVMRFCYHMFSYLMPEPFLPV